MSASAGLFDSDTLIACVDLDFSRPFLEHLLDAMRAGPHDAGLDSMSLHDLIADDLDGLLDGADTSAGDFLVKAYGRRAAAALVPKGKPQTIAKRCREQFPGRTVVASCKASSSVSLPPRPVLGDAGMNVEFILETIYLRADVSHDASMRGCLAAKGDWTELPQDSAELHSQRLRQNLEKR